MISEEEISKLKLVKDFKLHCNDDSCIWEGYMGDCRAGMTTNGYIGIFCPTCTREVPQYETLMRFS